MMGDTLPSSARTYLTKKEKRRLGGLGLFKDFKSLRDVDLSSIAWIFANQGRRRADQVCGAQVKCNNQGDGLHRGPRLQQSLRGQGYVRNIGYSGSSDDRGNQLQGRIKVFVLLNGFDPH